MLLRCAYVQLPAASGSHAVANAFNTAWASEKPAARFSPHGLYVYPKAARRAPVDLPRLSVWLIWFFVAISVLIHFEEFSRATDTCSGPTPFCARKLLINVRNAHSSLSSGGVVLVPQLDPVHAPGSYVQ